MHDDIVTVLSITAPLRKARRSLLNPVSVIVFCHDETNLKSVDPAINRVGPRQLKLFTIVAASAN